MGFARPNCDLAVVRTVKVEKSPADLEIRDTVPI